MMLPTSLIERDLRSLIKGDVEFDQISRHLYATDASLNQIEPLGVISPRDNEDVVRLVEYAAEQGLSLVPRGMGSGLAGGAVGAGIQVDFTRYMNAILEVAPDGSWTRVQPGVVMAALNQHLKSYGTFFAPDPSSENYCSLGGMIGTNSSGARTVAYGGTKDHVLALEIVLADGSVFAARPHQNDDPELASLLAGSSVAGKAFATILPRLSAGHGAILAAMPHVVKNCSGYRIETVLDVNERPHAETLGRVNPHKLFVGAEGTLGLVTEATLNLVPLPARRDVAMAYFPSVFASGEAVPGILELAPTAVEIMDSRFLALARAHDSRLDTMLPPRTETALLIEFEGRDNIDLEEKFVALRRHLDTTAVLKVIRAESVQETERLWKIRKSAVALALRMPGPRRALPFIEDVTVHPTEIPAYVDFLQRLFDRENVDAVMYGHVGDGNIHTRPLLDPKNSEDLLTMQRIYDEVSDYVLSVHGTMSGEHGDGLLRTPYISRMYGEHIYTLFSDIKKAFDPNGVMNPGKKVAPQEEVGAPLLRNLRYGTSYRTVPQRPILHFPDSEYEREIEKCHGCAQCKSVVNTTMCPTYKATSREHASPRAKANLLRAIITGALDSETTYGRAATKAVTDYCIMCGMCAVECPSHVNIPKLMLEAKSKYRALHTARPVEMLLGHAEWFSQTGHRLAPLANPLLNQLMVRRLVEPLTGIDRRRSLAPFARRTFRELVAARAQSGTHALEYSPPLADETTAPLSRTVAYFYDLYANYNDPKLAFAVKRLLEAHGIHVLVPNQHASGIPEMLYGYAKTARRVAENNLRSILPCVKEGALLVSSEPTASFAFKVHYPDYLASAECSLVANATHDLGEFLVRYRLDHPETVPQCRPPAQSPLRIAYHLPCHLKAQEIGSPGLELLREIPGIDLVDLDSGCCGMAGTFGMKAGTYDFSMVVGRPLFSRIAHVRPDLVATECSTCRMQISQATGLTCIHPALLLAQAYGAES